MVLRIYNTLTRNIEDFLTPGSKVRMFVCGPTVYDYIHLGNARTYVFFDILAKYLRHQGYNLTYLQNITDIDDKIISRSAEAGSNPPEYAQRFTDVFLEDTKQLGISSVDIYAKATEHIPEIISQVSRLIEKGTAYTIDGEGIYFDLTKFDDYGKLSGRNTLSADDAVSRIDESTNKRNYGDFCLWKFKKEKEPSWPAPFGDGRPGWHIEDTAISEKYFGPQYDLHGGAVDLIFPHHEAEIAQQETSSGLSPFVRFWVHSGFLVNKERKMSKSLANFMTAREALKHFSVQALRLYFISAHYRSPLDFSEDILKQSEAAVHRLAEFNQHLVSIKSRDAGASMFSEVISYRDRFYKEIDDDLNLPSAIGVFFEFIKFINHSSHTDGLDAKALTTAQGFINEVDSILGIIPQVSLELPEKIKSLVEEREKARQAKNYHQSDFIRQQIEALGFTIDDTSFGPLVKRGRS